MAVQIPTKPSIALYAFEKHPGTPSASGFCQKAECYLRFAGVEFHQVDTLPMKAPKGKLPYVVVDGTTVADSQFIVRYLKAAGIANLDSSAGLTAVQIADSDAYRGHWEEGIYSAIVKSRWFVKKNQVVIKREIFGDLPFYLRIPFSWLFARTITSNLIGHGMGRHTDEETDIIIREALENVEVRLAHANASVEGASPAKPAWFHATATPSDIDAVLSAMFINACATEANPYPKNIILKSDVLRGYMKRAVVDYFPEFQNLLEEIVRAEKKDD